MQNEFEQQVDELNSQVVMLFTEAKYEVAVEVGLRSYELARAHLASTHPALISSVNNLAGLYREMGSYEKAEQFYLQGLELRRAAYGELHRDIASSLNNLAALYSARGRYAQAENLHLEALAMWRVTVGENHPEYANTASNLAHLYHIQGDYNRALPLCQQALTIRQAILDERDPAVAVSLNNLAMLYCSMGTPLLAQPLLERSLAIRRESLHPSPPAVATALTNLASFHYIVGAYDQAEPLYREALTIWRSVVGKGHSSYTTTASNLALIYRALGDNRRARALWRHVLRSARKVHGERHKTVATARLNLGLMYFYQDDLERAQQHLVRALLIRKAIFGKLHLEVAHAANALGLVLYRQGDYQRAEKLFRRAIAILRRSIGSVRELAIVLNNLGALLHANGTYERAEELYRQALEILCSNKEDVHPRRADILYNLARTQWMMGQVSDALAGLSDATSIDHQTLGVFFSLASESQRMGYLHAAKGRLDGFLSLVLSERDPAYPEVRTAMDLALRRKGLTAEASVAQRAALMYGRHPKQALRLRELRALDNQIARAYLDGPSTSDTTGFHRQLTRWKARRERLEARLALVIREVNLARRLSSVNVASVAKALPSDTALVEYLRFTPLEANSAPGHVSVEFRPDRYAALVVPARRPDQAELVDLGEANLIDSYIKTVRLAFGQHPGRGERGNARRGITGLRNQGTTTEEERRGVVGPEKFVRRNTRFIRRADDAPRPDTGDIPAAEALRQAIFDPVERALGACRALIISPDGDLNLLPFGILPVEMNARLVDKYAISYVSAGREVLNFGDARSLPALTNDQVGGDPLVIADPDYDLDDVNDGREQATVDQQRTGLGHSQAKPSAGSTLMRGQVSRLLEAPRRWHGQDPYLRFQRLPETRKEGTEVASLLHVSPLLGKEALETHVKSARAPRILHIATHGFFLSDQQIERVNTDLMLANSGSEDRWWRLRQAEDPLLRSGLAFAGANTWLEGREGLPSAEDGLLTARDVMYLDLEGTDLVTLSACETGMGQVHVGEGVFGLRRAFTQAGAKALLMSLWRIPDLQTRELMSAFYQRLLAGASCVDALRQAQLDLRQRYPDPYYWGAFICSGEPGPLNLHEGDGSFSVST